ncbi:hypothetical protein [Anaeromyxobacter oryzae]|uniref:Uncharacterized protein n=1 Tax=Anaeromyxobacter oryzae TaxID=2918170 RepID=A0ABM7WY36_9BACT|nr:hypothetical protein [Anaeromyxobacter oryzae]BDG04432.1 hypothetical protein AMOR_34280 [Anaeromyxobacter oryzae]
MDPMERQRQRELAIRREQELKDLETESDHRERPLEGLSSAPTSWTQEQDDRAAETVHAGDEAASEALSREQVPPPPADRTLPERGEDER